MTTPVPGQREGRGTFEEWAKDQGWRPVMRPSGVYDDWLVRELFNAWQARDAEVLSSRRQALERVARHVDEITGPTGGWLDSPAHMKAWLRALGEVIPQAGEEGGGKDG